MSRRGRVGVAAVLAFAGPLLLAHATLPPLAPVAARGHSLFFYGVGSDSADQVRVKIDDAATAQQGPPVDVGAEPFTIELFLRATAADNTEPGVYCGANAVWLDGNVFFDRNRVNQNRKFGLSVAGGVVVFGVSTTTNRTICGTTNVLDDRWHHIAAQYRPSDGALWLFVDGRLEATGTAAPGDVSYPDDGVPALACGSAPCTSDTFIGIGSSKRYSTPDYKGFLDEVRISKTLRYAATFVVPDEPFATDEHTVALYHLDEGDGTVVRDSSEADGGPSDGQRLTDGADRPRWRAEQPFGATSGGGGAPATGGGGGGAPSGDSERDGSPGGGAAPGTPTTSGESGGGVIQGASDAPAEPDLAEDASSEQRRRPRRIAFGGTESPSSSVPPIAGALVGLGLAIFIGARFLRGDRL